MAMPHSPSKQLNFLSNNNNDKQGIDHEKANPFSALSQKEGRASINPGFHPVGPPNLATGGQLTPFSNENQRAVPVPPVLQAMNRNISKEPQVGSTRHASRAITRLA